MQQKGLGPIVTFRLFSCVPIKKRMSQMKPYFLSGWFSSTSSEFSYKNAMGLCTISCETTAREGHIFNWPICRKKKKKKTNYFGGLLLSGLVLLQGFFVPFESSGSQKHLKMNDMLL